MTPKVQSETELNIDVDDSPKLNSDDFEDLWADFESKKESKLRKVCTF